MVCKEHPSIMLLSIPMDGREIPHGKLTLGMNINLSIMDPSISIKMPDGWTITTEFSFNNTEMTGRDVDGDRTGTFYASDISEIISYGIDISTWVVGINKRFNVFCPR